MECYPLRLTPGQDLKAGLDALVREKGWGAAIVLTGIGSLAEAAIRLADKESPTRLEGPLEIISLAGTLSPGGSHLHILVSDARGVPLGGHLTEGSIVRTTAEIVLGVLADCEFHRVVDPVTGYRELSVRLSPRIPRRPEPS